ncbi:MAG: hypothetical protein ISR69_07755 [Gammaproteobacteria bacterium]|nr:hypothetical protein [Gammaproteobacteria bacterium]
MHFSLFYILFLSFSALATPKKKHQYETEIFTAIDQIKSSKLDAALSKSQAFIEKYPTNKIAHLMYSNLQEARVYLFKNQ